MYLTRILDPITTDFRMKARQLLDTNLGREMHVVQSSYTACQSRLEPSQPRDIYGITAHLARLAESNPDVHYFTIIQLPCIVTYLRNFMRFASSFLSPTSVFHYNPSFSNIEQRMCRHSNRKSSSSSSLYLTRKGS